MSLTDLIIPPWLRMAAVALIVATIFAGGYRAGSWVSNKTHAGELATAQKEAADLRASIEHQAATQSAQTVQTVVKQTTTSNEVSNAYETHRRNLEQRIAAGGLRLTTGTTGRDACALPTLAPGASQSDPTAAQSATAESRGSAQQVIDDAARDAQQLADLIDWVCRQGMCIQQ